MNFEWLQMLAEMVAGIFLLAGGLPVLYLTVLGFAGLVPGRKSVASPGEDPLRIAILIPAHNETLLISETVADAFEQAYPKELFTVLVIADNCSDDTADLARAQGAEVLVRQGDPGKGQALNEAFGLLLKQDWDAVLIVDADTRLHPHLLSNISVEMRRGTRAIQAFYGVLNPNETRRTAAMELALSSFNGLRPRGKTVLGLSSGLFGNGFCLHREVLEKVPYLARSIVEDLEYHLRLLDAGVKVKFLDRVWVKAQMPATAADSSSQRVRWERGRMTLALQLAPGLIKRIFKGKFHAIDALTDVCMPPASILALFFLGSLALGNTAIRIGAFSGIFLMALHYLMAGFRFGSPVRTLQICFFLPWYLVWKTIILGKSFLTSKHLPWVRTKRH